MRAAFVYMNNELNVGRGAGYVAASVARAGHSVEFFDTFFISVDALAAQIVRDGYDVLMVSAMTMIFPEALKLVSLVKEERDIPVLVGGIHPTIIGPELLDMHREIDYLCLGEGESMAVEFLDRLGSESLYDVLNLAYRRNGRAVSNPRREAEDLSKLPPFPWQYFRKESVVQEQGFLYVTATRGCPYNCTYCSNGIYLKEYGKSYLRYRPVESVIEELKYLHKTYSPRLFYFGDEMILMDRKYALELFGAIKRELNLPYGCMARVEHIDQEIVKVFHDTGCQYIGMGVECGDEEFRKNFLNRRMSNKQIEAAFATVRRAGIFVTSFNMIGYPFENDKELTEETIKLNKRLNPDYAQFSIFYPIPGTVLCKRCADLDLIDPDKISNAQDYFTESVLKGFSLRDKLKEINSIFNPMGLQFAPRDPQDASSCVQVFRNFMEANDWGQAETAYEQALRDNAELNTSLADARRDLGRALSLLEEKEALRDRAEKAYEQATRKISDLESRALSVKNIKSAIKRMAGISGK